MITFCPKCKDHEYQDNKLGKNMRYANPTTKGAGDARSYRCTVCSNMSIKQLKPKDWMPPSK